MKGLSVGMALDGVQFQTLQLTYNNVIWSSSNGHGLTTQLLCTSDKPAETDHSWTVLHVKKQPYPAVGLTPYPGGGGGWPRHPQFQKEQARTPGGGVSGPLEKGMGTNHRHKKRPLSYKQLVHTTKKTH